MKTINSKADVYEILETIEADGDLWHRDGIRGPSARTLRTASDVLGKLLDDYGVLPKHIVQTVEEGLYLDFEGITHRVILELYNEGDAAILILDRNTNETIESIDVPSFGRV